MDITHATFPQELIGIIQHIADSRFVAFDLEFSGVAARRSAGGSGKLSLQEYYQDLRSAAQIYQILQIGLTIVSEDTEKAISFLIRNGFNIERPFSDGVHYLSREEEQQVRQKLSEDDKVKSNLPDMILKDEDSVLVDHIKQSVNEWQSLPTEQQENYLNIPAEDAKDPIPSELSRYQVRLTHQIVRSEWPKLKTRGMGHFVQITKPTDEQQATYRDIRAQNREREIAHAVGFRWGIEAIMGGDISRLPHYYVEAAFPEGQAPKDIQGFLNQLQQDLQRGTRAFVGHNCLTDLINLYRCFIGDLPERVEDFSARVIELFPIVLDTKYLATVGSKYRSDTSLKAVESDLSSMGIPRIHLPSDFDRYLHAATYHEAGFDSFVTAKIGLKLPGKLKREGKGLDPPVGSSALIMEETTTTSTQAVAKDVAVESEAPKKGLTTSVVDVLKAPVTMAKSLLVGSEHDTQERASAHGSGKGATVAAKEKLQSVSRRSNIFDLLEDEPSEASEEQDAAQEDAETQRRIAEMVDKGELLPRWEEDGEFWRLISNRLQANACEEGFLDMRRPLNT
ncbi:hypothetical protein LTR92_001916 [Exophiala xenobiotica]|nr:hypothetical protein LTR92_001916 [Exophiala xenobiotica]KAK5451274.1 hypothetical protein LTR18_001293 [Exophiala xenobiotica]